MPEAAFGESPRVLGFLDGVYRDGVGDRLDEPGRVARDEYAEAGGRSRVGDQQTSMDRSTHYRTQHWQFSSFQIFSNSWISCTASCSCRRSPPVLTMTDTQSQLAAPGVSSDGQSGFH